MSQPCRKLFALVTLGTSVFFCGCPKNLGKHYFPAISESAHFDYALEYKEGFLKPKTAVMIVRRDGQETIANRIYEKQVTQFVDVPGWDPQIAYYRRAADGIYKIDERNRDKPECLFKPFAIGIGSTWVCNGVRYQALSIETLNLADRKYENCLKVSFALEDTPEKLHGAIYFAPGIGCVKGMIVATNLVLEYTLQNYKL